MNAIEEVTIDVDRAHELASFRSNTNSICTRPSLNYSLREGVSQ